jgi:ABC-2 type transport system permease protein
LLMSAAYIAIGLFASSITNNQIVAFLLALLIGVFFHFIFDMMSYGSTGIIGQILSVLSVNKHYESLSKGVLDSKDLIFFFSLTFVGLYLSELFISKRVK